MHEISLKRVPRRVVRAFQAYMFQKELVHIHNSKVIRDNRDGTVEMKVEFDREPKQGMHEKMESVITGIGFCMKFYNIDEPSNRGTQ